MLLESGGDNVRFKTRPLSGADGASEATTPDTLVLDGQQRLTALLQSLMNGQSVETRDTKGKAVRRRFYIDMRKGLDPNADREDAVIIVPEDGIVRRFGGGVELDVSTAEREFEQHMFPVDRVFDSAEWRQAYSNYWNFDRDKMMLFNEFERDVIKRFEQYQVPVIQLRRQTPKEAVCLVFERVNTGGVVLTVFELLTATFAADDYQLRDDWSARERRLKDAYPVLRSLQSDDFLQAITLLVTMQRREEAIAAGVVGERAPGIGCKRKDILKLEVDDWKTWADRVEDGFGRAARFLYGQKVFTARDLPYRTQLVPLAASLVVLGTAGDTEGARQAISRWYWCGVFGELYGGATETRFARDLPELVAHIRDGAVEPTTVSDANFQPERLLTLRTRNSSAYKGIYALLMRDGCRDFRTGDTIEAQTYFEDKIDIHHVFPEAWCKRAGIPRESYNSVVNKTPLSATTNRQIGGRAPSVYVPSIQSRAGIEDETMTAILASHRIESELLRGDQYWRFFAQRAEALLSRIEHVMRKEISRRPGVFDQGFAGEPDDYDDAPAEDWLDA